jgi:metallo-beta-lactamase family protein
MISIEFCGAAKTVTGSNYLVKTDHGSFVVDCGMFQGPDVEHLNLEEFDYDASKVDFAFLTHAHVDHSGMLPKLFKHGFTGPIYATHNTIQISNELLLDSAKLQEKAFQRGDNYGKYTQIKGLVYNTRDALETINLFKAVHFNDVIEPVPGIKAKYLRAGHILGAASIEFAIEDEGKTKTIMFSGDIGRMQSPLIPTFDMEYKGNPDYIIMESLYGGQVHVDRNDSAQQLMTLINETVRGKGNAFIPCFAVQRTQEVINDMKFAKVNGTLDNDIPVWLDSPLAQRVTNIYNTALQHAEESLFDFPNLIYVKKYKQSVQLSKKQGQVILAGSGMADGGRIMDHLTTGLENSRNSVIFVGYQAEGTLGRQLVEGAKSVTIGTKKIKVNAKIHQLEGFSAHGDTNDYVAWVKRLINPDLKKIFLIHAEVERAEALKTHFESIGITNSYIPNRMETITL